MNSPPLRFCGNCGTSLVANPACPSCGFSNPPTQNFCGQCGTDLRPNAPGSDRPEASERRHLTVMFCDLVGSTALSEVLDPEELSEVILAYREVVAEAVARFDGYVARFIGDGILVYFGYPRAHGDDPVRALHAALATLAGIRRLVQTIKSAKDVALSARIGIHTGLAVVGELARGLVREEAGVVGETPNLAARLIDLAKPDTVLVSGVTHALIKNEFECHDLGRVQLRGLSRTVNIFEVMCKRSPANRIEFSDAMQARGLAGRERELSFLDDRWRHVVDGTGQVISVVGEPGIGKSRLVRAFADHIVGSHHLNIVFHCSPHFSNSALFPVVDYINQWLDRVKRDKLTLLADAAAAVGLQPAEVVPIIATLLSLPIAAPYQPPQASAKAQRDLTMEFLLQWLMRQATDRPTLLVVEDVHWADASSIELVMLLLNQIQSTKILLLLTFRSDFHPPWPLYSHFSHLPLDGLTTAEVHQLIGNITGGKRLPNFVRDQLVEKTDGVPLFVEELTKAVLESDVLVVAEGEHDYKLRASPLELDIPISLHATLMARLDNLNSAKLVAQRAAVIGREFSFELIAAITNLSASELEHALAQLVAAELLFQRGLPPRATYVFKHSMIQETAYQSLLRASRMQYHRQIAEIMVARFHHTTETQPELVAHHFSAARMAIEAANYWRKGAERALVRSANVEALAHINQGLQELTTCPKSSLRVKEEVLLLTALGAGLTASKGYAAPEVAQTYGRARELCRELDDPSHLFPVLRGLHSFYLLHGPLRTACEMVEQLRRMADQAGNALQRVEAYRRLGWCLFCMGRLGEAHDHLGKALADYDRAQSGQHIVGYGSDAGVIGLVNLAWLDWFAGRADSAIRHSDEAIALARELSHGLSLAYALGMSAALYQCLGDPEKTVALAEETISLAEKYDFPYWVAWETGLLGWARATLGHEEDGVEMLHKGLAAYRATGAELFCSYMLGLLAQLSLRAKRFGEALSLCQEALASGARTDVHFFDAELYRMKGECLFDGEGDLAAAETCFEQAVAVARGQGARMLELRGAIALAALRRCQGRSGESHTLLSEALAPFGADRAAPDVERARRLLAECGDEARRH